MKNQKARDHKGFHRGFDDGLEPVRPLDVTACRDLDELLRAMSSTAFGGRKLGEAADVLYEMVADPRCSVVMTISGAMTVAKMSLLVCEMIEREMVQALVTTGALMAHGLVESQGMTHFKYTGAESDEKLFEMGYDRVYDTLELESNLIETEIMMSKVLAGIPKGTVLSSRIVNTHIGKFLAGHVKGRGILKSAHKYEVPVYVPAFTDSEMAIDLSVFNHYAESRGEETLRFDPFVDMMEFTELFRGWDRVGIFTIGGGVPRNWAQQAAPHLEQLQLRGLDHGKLNRYTYGVRICPEPVHLGSLSGCTYSEGVSWGKFASPAEGGRFAEVPADATMVWPFLLKAVIERLEKNRRKPARKKDGPSAARNKR